AGALYVGCDWHTHHRLNRSWSCDRHCSQHEQRSHSGRTAELGECRMASTKPIKTRGSQFSSPSGLAKRPTSWSGIVHASTMKFCGNSLILPGFSPLSAKEPFIFKALAHTMKFCISLEEFHGTTVSHMGSPILV